MHFTEQEINALIKLDICNVQSRKYAILQSVGKYGIGWEQNWAPTREK
jgi:hypothetical protein